MFHVILRRNQKIQNIIITRDSNTLKIRKFQRSVKYKTLQAAIDQTKNIELSRNQTEYILLHETTRDQRDFIMLLLYYEFYKMTISRPDKQQLYKKI
jgi:hypothetical protein